jgi:hypothetical protein
MKKNYLKIAFIINLILLSGCSEEKLPTPPTMDIEAFPSEAGTNYTFNISFGQPNSITGIKKSRVLPKANIKLNSDIVSIYQPQLDSIIYQGNTLIDTTYFRKTSSGVFYFIDTTGFSQLVPDSLKSFLAIDTESRILFFPLSLNQTWPVYQVDIKIGGIPVFSPIRAFAKVVDFYKMDFVVRNSKITSNVYKIEYNLEIQLSPEGQIERQTAIAHFATGIGFIKWEGQTNVVNLVKGTTFNYPSEFIIEELSSYFIP